MPATAPSTEPSAPVFNIFETSEVIAKLVVVAAEPVALEKLKLVRVDEAVETKPPEKSSVVEVACSLVPSLVNGKEKELPQPAQVVKTRFPIVAEPRVALLARRSVVEARPETWILVVVASEDKSLVTVPEAAVKF